MELTDHVAPAPKVESVRTYSEAEEATFVSMVNDGAFVEAIAEALGRSVNSIRGKALSLLRSGDIDAIPRQENTKGSSYFHYISFIFPSHCLSISFICHSYFLCFP